MVKFPFGWRLHKKPSINGIINQLVNVDHPYQKIVLDELNYPSFWLP